MSEKVTSYLGMAINDLDNLADAARLEVENIEHADDSQLDDWIDAPDRYQNALDIIEVTIRTLRDQSSYLDSAVDFLEQAAAELGDLVANAEDEEE